MNNREKELERMVESMENYIEELRNYRDKRTKKCSKVLHRDNTINDLCSEFKNTSYESKEYCALKEFQRIMFFATDKRRRFSYSIIARI